jgi:uncharacterized membrane protein (UPF0127 family)
MSVSNDLSNSQDESRILIQSENSTILAHVEIADDSRERNQGLMFRESLELGRVMFFCIRVGKNTVVLDEKYRDLPRCVVY